MPAKYSVLGMQNFHPLLLIIRVLNEHKLEVKLENWSIVELSEFDYCQNCGAQLFGNENISIMWRNTCPPTATPFTAPLVESNTAENLDDWPRLGTNSETLFAEIISTKHNQILWVYSDGNLNNFLMNITHNKPDFLAQFQKHLELDEE